MAEHKPTYVSKLIWMLEAGLFEAISGFLRLLPMDSASSFGGWVFRTLGPLTKAHKVAERNLRIAFPSADDYEIDELLHAQWTELGRSAAEFPMLDRIAVEPARLVVQGVDRLHGIANGGGPVVFISGHFSNFEVMAAAILQAGVPCYVTYRAMNNPYVEESVRRNRFRYGVRMFAPKGIDGARELMRALGRGESVAMLADQKFNAGVAGPFFGRTAYTAPGPVTFALRFGVPIQPLSVQRIGPGARFKVMVHDPIIVKDTGNRTADIEAGVRQINAFMEDRIRERPGEWFWVHKRWPTEAYQNL